MSIQALSKIPEGRVVHFHSICASSQEMEKEITLEIDKYGILPGDQLELEGRLGAYTLLVHEKLQLLAISTQYADLLMVTTNDNGRK